MQIFFPKEKDEEIRATILPEVAKKFIDLGIEVLIEEGKDCEEIYILRRGELIETTSSKDGEEVSVLVAQPNINPYDSLNYLECNLS